MIDVPAKRDDPPLVHDIWAWVAEDDSGEEGIIGLPTRYGVVPALGTNPAWIASPSIREGVRIAVAARGRPAFLRRYHLVEGVETLQP